MSRLENIEPGSLGDLAFESKVRAADVTETFLRVYGVDRTEGLTPDAKYTSKELSRYKVLRPGMFAYNPMRLNIGSIAACTDKHGVGLVSPDYVVFGCKPDALDPAFLGYAIKGPAWRQWTAAAGVGSVRVRIYFRELAKMPMTVPPLAEQRAIAGVLGSLDDKIELNRRMNATLEGMARALFQSWFVDFDPVRAKLDGRPPANLDPATAELFPDHLEESQLGHIPTGWKAGTVVEGFNLTMGQSPPGDTYNEEGKGLPFYQGRTDFGFRFPTRRIYCSAPTRYAKPGDTLVSVRAPVGDINMANEECCIGRGVAAVRHKSGATSFTYHSMANLNPDFARFEAEGTVFGSINKDSFEKLQFVIPPTAIVAAYECKVGPLDEQIRILENQSRTLATLRDTLLPKLLSGEMRVSEALNSIEEAVR